MTHSISTTLPLNNGYDIPALGLGTSRAPKEKLKVAIGAAIDNGFRHIDCAPIYKNEKDVGEALSQKIGKDVDRKDLFITSKLWGTNHRPVNVRPALLNTLKDLQLEYLDLYLIHWPVPMKYVDDFVPKDELGNVIYDFDAKFAETWREMEKAVDDGLVRSIGLSNFNSKQIDEICSMARIKPAVLQCESHPYLSQINLLNHIKQYGIIFTAYSPLGSPERPAFVRKPEDKNLLEDSVVKDIATKYGKSPAQICIKWQLQRGISLIPKSSTPSRIKENAEVFDFKLNDDDMKAIGSLNCNWRAFHWPYFHQNKMVDGQLLKEEPHPLDPFVIPY